MQYYSKEDIMGYLPFYTYCRSFLGILYQTGACLYQQSHNYATVASYLYLKEIMLQMLYMLPLLNIHKNTVYISVSVYVISLPLWNLSSTRHNIFTCKVIKTVLLKYLKDQRQKLPHLCRDLLTGQTVSQGEDFLIEFWNRSKYH